ncbi:MAG: hypothetical protein ACYDDI_10610 [Candidatus Acidiferrales bacterium]
MPPKTRKSKSSISRAPVPRRISPTDRASALERHSRKCVICRHRDCDAIETAFLYWQSPHIITRQFKLPDWRSIYRHAHATGLYQQRRHDLRSPLEKIIERSDEAEVRASDVIQAIRAYACLNDSGEWIEPASRVIHYSSGPRGVAAPPPASNAAEACDEVAEVIEDMPLPARSAARHNSESQDLHPCRPRNSSPSISGRVS